MQTLQPASHLTVKHEMLSPKIRNKARMSPQSHSIKHRTGCSSQCNKERKGNKMTQIGKEEVRLSVFTVDMIVYVEIFKKNFFY